jgi:CheY-like chemotaxis protein
MKKAVLFVDDNEVLSRLSCDILHREGYRAVPAYSGYHALELLEQENFDLVITDFRMGGMDGMELACAIHQRQPHLPVVMVTAYGPVEGEHVRLCLAKDRLFPALLEQIRVVLSEKAAA